MRNPVNNNLDERYEIAKLLRTEKIVIPDLHHLFEAWPEATSVHLDSLRVAVDEDLNQLFPPGRRRAKLKAADPALFGAMWWPHASFERLCIATYLSIWLFAWDDEVDSPEFSELSLSLQDAQAFRSTTLERIRGYLALDSKAPRQHVPVTQTATRRSIIEEFAPVGHAMVKHYALDQRQALMREIDLFIKMCAVEQWVQLNGQLPTIESYQRRRMGSSAVAVCLAIHEYTLNMRLPHHVMINPHMKTIWDQSNVIISVSNDIVSVKKELAQNQVDSLIPLLYIAHNHDIQAAMTDATQILKNAIAQFDTAAINLLDDVAHEDDASEAINDVRRFIDSCRYACTANLNWSLCSGRYTVDVDGDVDGDANVDVDVDVN